MSCSVANFNDHFAYSPVGVFCLAPVTSHPRPAHRTYPNSDTRHLNCFFIARITTLDRYVAREVLAPFAFGVVLLTFALVSGKVLKLTDMVVYHGVRLEEVL